MARQTVFPQPLLVLGACGLLAAALVAEQPAPQQPAPAPADAPFRNAALPIESRIDGLLAAMTLDEKLACLQTSTAVPRLGVPDMGASEGLHQLVRRGGFGPANIAAQTSTAPAAETNFPERDMTSPPPLGRTGSSASDKPT